MFDTQFDVFYKEYLILASMQVAIDNDSQMHISWVSCAFLENKLTKNLWQQGQKEKQSSASD